MRLPDRKQGGFSLVELLVAVVILSIGMMGTASLVVGIIRGNKVSREMTTGATLAQDKLEDLRRIGFTGMPASDTTTIEAYGSISGYSSYKRVVAIDVDNPAVGLNLASVTVFWGNDQHSMALKTIMAK